MTSHNILNNSNHNNYYKFWKVYTVFQKCSCTCQYNQTVEQRQHWHLVYMCQTLYSHRFCICLLQTIREKTLFCSKQQNLKQRKIYKFVFNNILFNFNHATSISYVNIQKGWQAHQIDKYGQVKFTPVTTRHVHRPTVCTFSSAASFDLPVGHPLDHAN
jgi:hypothetical protein